MKTDFVKRLMKLRERTLEYGGETGAIFHEVFHHPEYLRLSAADQRSRALEWARELYAVEVRQPLDAFIPVAHLERVCRNGTILDLGCYLGGKAVRWAEKYGGARLFGLDVAPAYLKAAEALAAEKGVRGSFSVGFAERIPFRDGMFDVVLSVNTFEHVRDVGASLRECRRVLKPGGALVVHFPPFFHPTAHHLDLVTKTPCLHWIFSYPTLLEAYFRVLDERGSAADWYRRPENFPLPFEKGYSINGVTAGGFHAMVEKDWKIGYDAFEDSRSSASRNRVKRFLDLYGKRIPIRAMRELFEVSYVLFKPQ